MSAADECGWRNYPPAGPLKYEVFPTKHEFYAYADVLEHLINRWSERADWSALEGW